jgi:hypothetical protein
VLLLGILRLGINSGPNDGRYTVLTAYKCMYLFTLCYVYTHTHTRHTRAPIYIIFYIIFTYIFISLLAYVIRPVQQTTTPVPRRMVNFVLLP